MLDCLVGVFLRGLYELDLANVSVVDMSEARRGHPGPGL